MRAYEVSKEILFMSDYLTLLYSGLNEFRGHTSFLEWANAFIVPIVHSSRRLRDLPLIHYTSDPISFQSIKIRNSYFSQYFSKLYFGEIATSRILKIT